MKLGRREFVDVLGGSAASTVISPFFLRASSLKAPETIEANVWHLNVAATGGIISLQNGKIELINSRLGDNHPRILIFGKKYYICNEPKLSRREGSTLIFQYKELSTLTGNSNSQLAFLASDVIGVRGWNQKAPYGLVAHGTYQDSGCRPEAWPYGLFPNFRNVLWSCNWAPASNFSFHPT